MAIDTLQQRPTGRVAQTRDGRRAPAVALLFGGLLLATGGQLHPVGSGDTVDGHLLSMFANPLWPLSHELSLAGAVLAAAGLVLAWRHQVFGPAVQRLLPAVTVAWVFGAAEQLPHLLASGEAHALAHHQGTPLLDLHLAMQVLATPAVGLSGAVLALTVARSAGTWPARLLAGVAIVGGIGYAAAAPLVVLTGDPRFALLFPFQAGLALWLVGTGVRLART